MTDMVEHTDRAEHAAALPARASEAFDVGSRAYVQEDNERAVEQLRQATDAAPSFDDAHYLLGLALLRTGEVDEAVAALRRTIEVTDNHILRRYAEEKIAEIETEDGD